MGNSTRLRHLKCGPSAVSPLPRQMDLFWGCKENERFSGCIRLRVIVLGDFPAWP